MEPLPAGRGGVYRYILIRNEDLGFRVRVRVRV